MYVHLRRLRIAVLLVLLPSAFRPTQAKAYSLLTHEQLIDLTWDRAIVPFLLRRFPQASAPELERARSFAYGGCVIQDIGYYPLGDRFFSDLTHYVRTGDFVANLFRSARTLDETAFAVGALSHYIGDTVGHPEATNLAVPVEFPKLRARFGSTVSYAQGEHAHVQTEFAFDIDQIAHRRFAPLRYLRHVGLEVPTRLVEQAFEQTYGIGEDFTRGRRRRLNVKAYRFAVRTLIPRVAFALTVLHRGGMPADSGSADFLALREELEAIGQHSDWQAYRRSAGLGTYSLASLIFVLPKLGPLKLLKIAGPTAATEEEYVRSLRRSSEALQAALACAPDLCPTLANLDLDTGNAIRPGTYRLVDTTYSKLLAELVKAPSHPIPHGLKANLLGFFADPVSPIGMGPGTASAAELQAELAAVQVMPEAPGD